LLLAYERRLFFTEKEQLFKEIKILTRQELSVGASGHQSEA
jgi:hypothetical protein